MNFCGITDRELRRLVHGGEQSDRDAVRTSVGSTVRRTKSSTSRNTGKDLTCENFRSGSRRVSGWETTDRDTIGPAIRSTVRKCANDASDGERW